MSHQTIDYPDSPQQQGTEMAALAIIPAALLILVAVRHRSTARAINRTSAREVWARASDTRYPRTPSRSLFGRRRGLK